MSNMSQPVISILTPTWNRAPYLSRVHQSLVNQTYQNFEWIISDDGSTDNTREVVHEFATSSKFPIKYIQFSLHVGKPVVDNCAIQQARGELLCWCDSDDFLTSNAVEILWQAWRSIPSQYKNHYSGVAALAATRSKCLVDLFPKDGYYDIPWNDLSCKHQVKGDMLICPRTDLMKSHPFPEVDFVVPESAVWAQLGHMQSRIVSKVLVIKEYLKDGISLTPIMSYNRGRAYALAITINSMHHHPRPFWIKLVANVTFIRYSLHGELPFSFARAIWGANNGRFIYWIAFPFSLIIAFVDRVRGKVHKSHRDFLANYGKAVISATAYPIQLGQ